MSKNLSVKRTLFTGTLLLTTAGILSRFIGFFYKIFLSRTIGAEGLGIYQLIFPRSEERRVGKECRSRWSPYH
mgnify:CR=1 FL=1